jgi:hypothetical protein
VHGNFISDTVLKLYEEHHEPRTRPSVEEGYAVLHSIISEYSRVFVLVDAVDEYPEEDRTILLRFLFALGPTVNLMLTSRPHVKVNQNISNFTTLEIRATADDIREYLNGQIMRSHRLSKHVRISPDLRGAIERNVVQRSDGMCV